MMKFSAIAVLFVPALIALARPAAGQAVPAVIAPAPSVGFQLPRLAGTLNYSLTASEVLMEGYYGGNGTATQTNVSGNVGILTGSATHPFSLVYSGGYLANTSGQNSTTFQSMSASQVLTVKRWSIVAADAASFLPDSPTTGLSGIPGLGDLGVSLPTQGANGGILSQYATRIINTASVGVQRQISGRTSIGGNGSYSIVRFPSESTNGGLESNQETGVADISHRLDGRSVVSVAYVYSQFSYLEVNEPFSVESVNLEYSRQVTGRLSVDLSAGPDRTGASKLAGTPALYSYAANCHANYTGRNFSGSVAYSRAINSGSGITTGAQYNTLYGSVNRRFSRDLSASASVGYTDSTQLQSLLTAAFNSKAEVAGVQANRALTRKLSAYASYNLQRQIAQGAAYGLTPQSGVSQILGFGVTYTPRTIHLGRE